MPVNYLTTSFQTRKLVPNINHDSFKCFITCLIRLTSWSDVINFCCTFNRKWRFWKWYENDPSSSKLIIYEIFQNLLEARKKEFLVNLSQYTAVHRTWIIPPQIRNAIRGNWKLLWLKSLGTTALRSALIDYSSPSCREPSTSFLEIIMVSKLFRSVYKMIIWYNLMVRHHLMMRACRGPRALIRLVFI